MMTEKYEWEKIEQIIEKYNSTLYKIAYSYTGNKEDSEDILQEVFIKFARQGVFKDEEHEKAWLIRVTVNQSINLVKSVHRKKTVALEDNDNRLSMKTVELGVESEVRTLVMELPIKYRAAIYLYYFEGYKVEEIAEVLGKRTTGVYTLLNRGREMLKKILEGGNSYE